MVTIFFYRIFRRTPSAPQPDKPKAVVPPPSPPVAADAQEAREIVKIMSREITNVVDLPTHLMLTEIEEYAGKSYHDFDFGDIEVDTDSKRWNAWSTVVFSRKLRLFLQPPSKTVLVPTVMFV